MKNQKLVLVGNRYQMIRNILVIVKRVLGPVFQRPRGY